MAGARFVAAVVVTFWCILRIDPAAIKSEDFSEALRRVTQGEIRLQRAIDSDRDSKQFCYNTPCGWEVYKPFSRQYEYYMKNTCVCPDSSYKCVRVDDDLSVSAYVYHCRQNSTAKDIEEPQSDVE